MKVAFQFTADAAGLIGGVRVSREEMDKLAATATATGAGLRGVAGDSVTDLGRLGAAANDAGAELRRVGDRSVVVSLEEHRRATGALSADMGEVSERAKLLQRTVADGATVHRQAADILSVHSGMTRSFSAALDGANDRASGLTDMLGTLAGGLKTMGALLAVDRVLAFGGELIGAASQAQQLERRLASLVGTGAALRDNQDWLSKSADRLGQSTAVLADSYARLLNLSRSGLVTVDQARAFTEGLANAQVKYAADAGRMGDVMYGLSQALASPIVHMEELNQVVEPLPGLLLDLDKAAGLPTGGFRKLIAEGRVTSEVFRDTLLKALKGYAGEAERASGSVEAAFQRIENAQQRFLANGGRLLIDGWISILNAGTIALNTADSALSWGTRKTDEAALIREQFALDQLLARRRQLEADRARYAAGAGGVYAKRNLAMTDGQLADVEKDIDASLAKLRTLETALGDAKDGWAEMWGSAEAGQSVTDKLAGRLADAADAVDLVVTRNGLLTKSEVELRTQTDVLTRVLALPPAELKKLGISAADAAFLMGQLEEKISPVAAAIARLKREAATVEVSPKFRDLYQTLDQVEQDKGRPLTDDESAGLTAAWRTKRNANSAEQVRLTNEAAMAADKLAKAQASGNPATIAAAQADKAVADALRDGVIVQADAASFRTGKLREAMAGLSGQAGEAATASSRQARQLLDMAAATEKGGAAVAAVTLAQQIENETLKVGAGAHGELAKRLTEEDAARRTLAAAQWNRDLDLQIAATKALAAAELGGAKAVAEATLRNQAAAQVEKEGVAVDGERAKAIGAKTAELAKWQQQQGYNQAIRSKDEEIQLLQLEQSLQGEGKTVRARTLELARAELEIRRQFPAATEDEVAALLRKHDAAIRLRADIEQQGALWTELGRLGEQAFDRVGSAITEAFAQGTASTISWGSIAKAVMSEVIQAALTLTVLNPMKNWMTGGNAPSLFSVGGSATGAQSGGGLTGSLTNTALSKGGGWAFDKLTGGVSLMDKVDLWGANALGIGTATSTIVPAVGGQAASLAATTINPATGSLAAYNSWGAAGAQGAGAAVNGGISAYLGAAGAGALGGGLVGGLLGTATNSKVVGGLSGAAAGAGASALASTMGFGALGGPVGIAIGAIVGGIMGMLGTVKASVGPNGAGNIFVDSNGAKSGPSDGDNGMDGSAMRQISDAAAASINTIITGIGATFQQAGESAFQRFTYYEKDGKWTLMDQAGNNRQDFSSQEQFISALIKTSIQRLDQEGRVSGVSDDVRTALRNSKATKAEDLASDLEFAAGFRAQLDLLNANLDPTNNQIKSFTASAKSLGEQVKTNIVEWRDKASELGLATETELTEAARKGIVAMMGLGPAAEPLVGMAAATKEAEINFEAFRPALVSLGFTAGEVAALAVRYTQQFQAAYTDAVGLLQRQAGVQIDALTNSRAALSAADQFRVAGASVATVTGPAFAALTSNLDTLAGSAHLGAVTVSDVTRTKVALDQALYDGVLTAEQYASAIGMVTSAYQSSQETLSTLRQGWASIAAITEPGRRQTASDVLDGAMVNRAGTGVSAFATGMDNLFRAVDGGTASFADLAYVYQRLVPLLQSGAITGQQFNTILQGITTTWSAADQRQQGAEDLYVRSLRGQGRTAEADAAERRFKNEREIQAAIAAGYDDAYIAGLRYVHGLEATTDAQTQAAARQQQVASSWSSLLSTAIQEVSEGYRTTAAAAKQAATAWGNVADALDRARRDIMTDSTYSNLGPVALRDAARDEFERLRGIVNTYASALQAGTATDDQRTAAIDAAGQLDAAGKTWLELQQALSGDRTAYNQTLTDVRSGWDETAKLGLTLKDSETKRADAAEAQIDRLTELTGLGSAQRALLDQIKVAIGAGNTDMAQLVTLVRQMPGYQPYTAPSDVIATWSGLSADARNSVAHFLGYSGNASDPGFNDFLVANGKNTDYEALVRGWTAAQAKPYAASAAADAGAATMTADELTAAARQVGWTGAVSDRAFNTFLVSTGQTGRWEALMSARAPAAATTATPEQQYVAAYPDVATSNLTALAHYILYGAREGRQSFGMVLSRDQQYIARYPDVADAYIRGEITSGAQHYQMWGAAEGRAYQRGGVIGQTPGGVVGNGLYGIDSVAAEYAGGGRIWLAGGEGVLTAGATDAIGGEAAIAWINRHNTLPPANDRVVGAYQRGGIVGGASALDWTARLAEPAPSAPTVTLDVAPVVTAIGGVRSAVLEIGGLIRDLSSRLANVEDAIDGLAAEQRALGVKILKVASR
ncbi:tape measure domain-containing protein [Azospirillum agricola]|uniref:tape measure protein n=1 Tax=Azospirillum agricola TaxID=1720247 RepID=UPI001AE1F576|nr:tape measure protein [Azospirillum agricola]MBP2231767.1 tape measure domain-containing protein [Azospirillum agricola]